MNPLQVLQNHYVGKKIVGGALPSKFNGCVIYNVGLENYEPIFCFILQFPDGRMEVVDVLKDWDIQVDPA
jgi:hypothetical protein